MKMMGPLYCMQFSKVSFGLLSKCFEKLALHHKITPNCLLYLILHSLITQ